MPSGAPYLFNDIIPVHRLLREKSRVLEVHGLYVEGQFPVSHLPALRQGSLVPLSSAGGGSLVSGRRAFPGGIIPGRVPNGLGVRAHEGIFAPPLQLFAARAVYKLKIPPFISDPHSFSPNINKISMYYITVYLHRQSRLTIISSTFDK